jgi:hypothetical protein
VALLCFNVALFCLLVALLGLLQVELKGCCVFTVIISLLVLRANWLQLHVCPRQLVGRLSVHAPRLPKLIFQRLTRAITGLFALVCLLLASHCSERVDGGGARARERVGEYVEEMDGDGR